jgi:hypothetical protein
LVATNLDGVFATPAGPAGIDPHRASRAELIGNGMLWRRPAPDAAPGLRRAWAKAFARPWPIEGRVIPHSVAHRGTSHAPRPRSAGDTTSPWGGAVVAGSWTTALASWVVPTVSQPGSPPGDRDDWESLSWVGLDGSSGSDDVLQVGVAQNVDSDGNPSASAWYEWFAPELPGSPDYIWETTIDNFEVRPGDTVWATVQYAGVLPPAASTTLASFETVFNDQFHVDYLSATGRIQELLYDGSWHYNDLMALVPGGAPPARPGSPLCGYATESNQQQHVIYFDANGRVQELLYIEGQGWTHNDLFAQCTGDPVPAIAGSALTGYVTTFNEQQHINYFDRGGRVHELYFDGSGWRHNDLFAISTGDPVPAAPGSALASYQTAHNEQQHIDYLDAAGHVHELVYDPDSQWAHHDLFALSAEKPTPAEPGSSLDGYETIFAIENFQQHVNYTDANGHVHELVYSDRWHHNDLMVVTGAGPARLGSPLQGYPTEWNNQQHVVYFDVAGDVRELYYGFEGSWQPNDVTTATAWSAAARTGSALAGWPGTHQQQHLNFVDDNGHVHELYYAEGHWIHNDLSAMATLTGVLWFGNDRTRQHFSITLLPPPGASFQGNTAEWIMETPLHGNGKLATLPAFTDITFESAVCCGPTGSGDPSTGVEVTVVEDGAKVTSSTRGSDTVTVTYIGP